ncbi:MAG: hypothetical protein P9L94_13400 [Candidatus Hinthialibacter antarcticus]|nr:hypothetical protein [Candidatus Hinthialibacter antarcticus]
MNVVIGFVLIVLLGYAGSRLALFQKRFSLGLQYVFLAGTEFLFIGLMLGPGATRFLTEQTLHELSPVLSLCLGWIGLLVGLQFDRKILAPISLRAWQMALTVSSITFVVVFASLYFLIPLCYYAAGDMGLIGLAEMTQDQSVLIGVACLFGAAATVSTYSALALIQRDAPVRSRTSKLLQLLTDLRSPMAVAGMGLWYALFHASTEIQNAISNNTQSTRVIEPVMSGAGWVVVTLLLGLALGWMLHYLTSERLREKELLLLVAGSVILSGGLSSYMHLSPLFVNLVMGVTLANLPNFSLGRITKVLLTAEKPFFVIFMILVGAMWPPVTPVVLLLTGIYVAVRAVSLITSAWLGRLWWPQGPMRPPALLGLAMFPFGGLSIAMAVDFHLIRPGDLAETALGVIILAVLINQLIGPALMGRVIRSSKERNGALNSAAVVDGVTG